MNQQKGNKISKKMRGVLLTGVIITFTGVVLDIISRSTFSIIAMSLGTAVVIVGVFIVMITNRRNDPRYRARYDNQILYDPHEKTSDEQQIKFLYQKATPHKDSICMISKTPLEDELDVLQCPQCKSFFLGPYLREWINEKYLCPVCKTKLVISK